MIFIKLANTKRKMILFLFSRFQKGRDEKWTKTNARRLGLTTLFIGNNLRNEKWRIQETKKLNLENYFLFSSAYIHHPPLLYAISCTHTVKCAGKKFYIRLLRIFDTIFIEAFFDRSLAGFGGTVAYRWSEFQSHVYNIQFF